MEKRTKIVYVNSIVALGSQICQVLIGFITRKLFIDYLGVEYLGYTSNVESCRFRNWCCHYKLFI